MQALSKVDQHKRVIRAQVKEIEKVGLSLIQEYEVLGGMLTRAKADVGHGNFTALCTDLELSKDRVARAMVLYETWGDISHDAKFASLGDAVKLARRAKGERKQIATSLTPERVREINAATVGIILLTDPANPVDPDDPEYFEPDEGRRLLELAREIGVLTT